MSLCDKCLHREVCSKSFTIKALERNGCEPSCEFFKQDIDYKAMVTHIVDVDDRTLYYSYISLKEEITLMNSYAKAMSSELLRREP